ncbi:hypothetical protein BD410DRAFT_794096 [Rickenella mellea]|uniref:Uncharacterized protein n=1 Tax=Rickenella mellea TaxID=50990 RepID=A0A4Y7PRI5_9AGAM|nr:hypothetical protein BD410DRAFT_794096 [Rickenella mellea]
MRSSPSHEPITPAPPPPMPSRGRALKKKSVNLRQLGHQGRRVVNPPPRVESTQPRETSPEPSSGEETAGEKFGHAHGQEVYVPEPGNGVRWLPDSPGADDEGEWVDDEFDLEEDDLLDLEFHTSYVISGDKRKKRWEARWNEFMRAFQALDRQTDTTLVLLAAPSHTHNLYSLSSRSIRRDASLMHSPSMSTMKTAFEQLASARRSSRSHQVSLMDRLTYATSSAGDGSPSSTSSQREEELRRALAAALGSLTELGKLYENREQRWTEEMLKQSAERDSVEVLLRQTLGVGMQLQNSDMRNGL